MKAKHAILLIALGFCLGFIGSYTQLLHRSEAQTLLMLAAIFKVGGVILLAYKVVSYDGFRKFMDR